MGTTGGSGPRFGDTGGGLHYVKRSSTLGGVGTSIWGPPRGGSGPRFGDTGGGLHYVK